MGRGGIRASGLKSLSVDLGSGWAVPQALSIASSEGPVQPNISPDEVTVALEVRVLSTISRREMSSSFSAGIEYARVVQSLNTPMSAQPRSSNLATFAASQKTSSQALWAPLATAGLKIRASICVTMRR